MGGYLVNRKTKWVINNVNPFSCLLSGSKSNIRVLIDKIYKYESMFLVSYDTMIYLHMIASPVDG